MLYGNAIAGSISVPLIDSLFETDTVKSVVDGGISFNVDKRADIRIKLSGVSEVSIDYNAEGYFYLNHISAVGSNYKINPLFLMGRPLTYGKGNLKLDFRRTLRWSPDSFPVLFIMGTGRFTVTNVEVATVSDPSEYSNNKNRAFFWRPEIQRPTTVNSLTPVYWNVTKKTSWTKTLGVFFLIAIFAVTILASFLRLNRIYRYIPKLSLFFILIFSVHFAIRFVPMVNSGFFLSSDEKIKKYLPIPELGLLVAAAREKADKDDKVIVMKEKGDWFTPMAICFNIAPVYCSQYSPEGESYRPNPVVIRRIDPSHISMIVSYNSDYEMPKDYEKVFELNRNVFIARKK